jgi:hypothetical protein
MVARVHVWIGLQLGDVVSKQWVSMVLDNTSRFKVPGYYLKMRFNFQGSVSQLNQRGSYLKHQRN